MRSIALLVIILLSGCYRPFDPAAIKADERCARLEEARSSGTRTEVPAAGVTVIGSTGLRGGVTLYDVACGYRLFGLAYRNDAAGNEAATRISALSQPGSSGRFYAIMDGTMIFPARGADYVLRLSRLRALSPVPSDYVSGILADLKQRHRVLPQRDDF